MKITFQSFFKLRLEIQNTSMKVNERPAYKNKK
jgi:hypothetical protein